MNRKLALRLLLDAVMLTVMVILMGPGVTGIPWHEIIGTAVLVLFIVHCAVNAWWFRAAAKRRQGRRTFYSVLRQTVNFLLLADSVLLLVSSLMISHSVFAFLGLSGGTVWVYLHRVSAYTEPYFNFGAFGPALENDSCSHAAGAACTEHKQGLNHVLAYLFTGAGCVRHLGQYYA